MIDGPARRARWARRVALALAAPVLLATGAVAMMVRMPGRSHQGPLPPLTAEQEAIAAALRRHVQVLAGDIGERNVRRPEALVAAAAHVERELAATGRSVARQAYTVAGVQVANLELELPGIARPDEVVVVGAHYDSVEACPGANDNGSGVAGLLVLASRLQRRAPARTLRLVAFVNEEPPWFQTEAQGARVYARRSRERGDRVVAMISVETIGYYRGEPGSQKYPFPFALFYPSTGDFLGFVADTSSSELVRRAIGTFRSEAAFPSEGISAPRFIPGIGWSDHEAFWREGYPAIMVTDTAPFRYPAYHTAADTPEKLDYERMARVVAGLERVVIDLLDHP